MKRKPSSDRPRRDHPAGRLLVALALDSHPFFSLKQSVQPSSRAPIESLLAELYQREKDLDGQIGELDEEIEQRRTLDKPIGPRRLAKLNRLLETLGTVKQRFDKLQAQRPDWLPPGVSAPGDF